MQSSEQLDASMAQRQMNEKHNNDMNIEDVQQPKSVTVIVTSIDAATDPLEYLGACRDAMEGVVEPFEFIFAGGAESRETVKAARDADFGWSDLVAVQTSTAADEDWSLKLAVARAKGDLILTLPGWQAPSAEIIRELFDGLDDNDLVVGATKEAEAAGFRGKILRWATRVFFNSDYSDLFCRYRLGKRAVFQDSTELGVRQHYLPLVAEWRGFKVVERQIPEEDSQLPERSVWQLGLKRHFVATMDFLMLFVVMRFLDRPLRFFSAIGGPLFLAGFLITSFLIIERLLGLTSLADRPAFVIGVLFLVLGVQIIAIGLVGEIIVYTSMRRRKTDEIEKIVHLDEQSQKELSSPR